MFTMQVVKESEVNGDRSGLVFATLASCLVRVAGGEVSAFSGENLETKSEKGHSHHPAEWLSWVQGGDES